MKLANQITLGRLALTVLGLILLALHPDVGPGEGSTTWWIWGLLVLAAATDALDGYVARRLDQTSRLGRMLDPFVDKILVCGALILMLRISSLREQLPAWVVVVVVARELFVTTLRGVVEAKGARFGADWFGKWKMTVQCFLVGALLAWQGGWLWAEPIVAASLWLTVLLTVLSGLNYQRKAWHALEF